MQRFILVFMAFVLSPISMPQVTRAGFLSPNNFSASSPFVSAPGSYTINTTNVQMTGPSGFLMNGVLSDGIAVFSFTDFFLGAGAGISTTGSRPAGILSRNDMTIGGNGIRALAGGGAGGEPQQRGMGPGGGFPGFNFFGGAGGGGGFGGRGGRGQFSNPTFDFPGAGGPTYGDLYIALQGGSGGGGGKSNINFQSAGGAGGGALELGANHDMIIAGSGINADGLPGVPRDSNHTAGGGGSGGGIRLHASTIINTALVAARGGRGGDGVFENGGGGGGGRILIQTSPGGLSNLGTISVVGGTAPSDFFGSGSPGREGVFTVQVPEPISLINLVAMLALTYLGSRVRHR